MACQDLYDFQYFWIWIIWASPFGRRKQFAWANNRCNYPSYMTKKKELPSWVDQRTIASQSYKYSRQGLRSKSTHYQFPANCNAFCFSPFVAFSIFLVLMSVLVSATMKMHRIHHTYFGTRHLIHFQYDSFDLVCFGMSHSMFRFDLVSQPFVNVCN